MLLFLFAPSSSVFGPAVFGPAVFGPTAFLPNMSGHHSGRRAYDRAAPDMVAYAAAQRRCGDSSWSMAAGTGLNQVPGQILDDLMKKRLIQDSCDLGRDVPRGEHEGSWYNKHVQCLTHLMDYNPGSSLDVGGWDGLKEVADPESVAFRRYECIYDCSGARPPKNQASAQRNQASAQRHAREEKDWEPIFKNLGIRYERQSTNTFLLGNHGQPSGRGAEEFRQLIRNVLDDLDHGRRVLLVCLQGQARSIFLACAGLVRHTDGRLEEYVMDLRALAYPVPPKDHKHTTNHEALHYWKPVCEEIIDEYVLLANQRQRVSFRYGVNTL